MLKPIRIRDFCFQFHDTPRESFLDKFRTPFLLVDIVDSRDKVSHDEPTVNRDGSNTATRRLESVKDDGPRLIVTYVVQLEVPEGEESRPFTLGRASDSDIVIYHPSVSRHHGRIEPAGPRGGFAVTDLGSSYGTEVSGEMLEPNQPRVLKDKDVVVLGQSARCTFLEPATLFDRLDRLEEA